MLTQTGGRTASEEMLLPLGHLSPNPMALELAIAEGRRNPVHAIGLLRRHRVLGIGAQRLHAAMAGDEPPELTAALASHRHRRQTLDELCTQLKDGIADLGIRAAGVKGYSTRSLYDQPEQRDLADIDLMIAHVDDAWRLAWWLRQRGFDWHEWELPWLKRDSQSGQLYGQAAIWNFAGADPVRVDIHFGGYSIRHCRLLHCGVTEPGLNEFDPTRNLLLLLGNAAGDFVIRVKDINDVVVMLEAEPPLDWMPALADVRHHGLDRFWNTLLSLTVGTSVLSERAQELAVTLAIPSTRPQRVPVGEQIWSARCRATVADAFRAGQRDHGAYGALHMAWTAYRYYRRRLRISVTASCSHRGDGESFIWNMRNDRCVRLVPTSIIRQSVEAPTIRSAPLRRVASISGTEILRAESAGPHTFVRAFDDVFAPTVFHRFCAVQGRYS